MGETEHTTGDWQPCPAGEINRMVHRIQRGRRTRRAAWVSAGGLLGALVIGVVIGFDPGGSETDRTIGGITCTEVRAHMKRYMTGEIDQELHNRITVHLDGCPPCRRLMQSMRKEPEARRRIDPSKARPSVAWTRRSLLRDNLPF